MTTTDQTGGAAAATPRNGPRRPIILLAALAAALLVGLGLDPRPTLALACGFAVIVAGAASLLTIARRSPLTESPNQAAPVEREPPFAAMVENLADPVLLVAGSDPGDHADRRFLYANAAARDLLRVSRHEGPLTTAIRAPEVLSAVEEALFVEDHADAEWDSRGAQERFWRVHVRSLSKSGGHADRGQRLALLTFHDETEVRRSESMRADFLANASHELRTPLASLTGFVETLRGHARDDPDARERFLAIMQAQAERMRRLIDDLMSLSRIELSEHIRPGGEVDLTAAVIDVLDALGPQAAERDVSFRSNLPPIGEAVAVGDRDQILQVAQNLIENAVKYTPSGGVVEIDILASLDAAAAAAPILPGMSHLSLLTPDPVFGQPYVLFRVRDRGAGIARGHLPRLTERFYRVEGQKARDRPGTGLGLAIVKHIINRHRGGLFVESAAGAGACFTVYIPMAPGAKPAMSPLAPNIAAAEN